MLDLFLILSLGFLGSFGHCTGMCGPLAVAFSLSQKEVGQPDWQRYVYFHSLLNLGRMTSYVLVGAGVGGVGSLLIAGGQLAGIDSPLRRAIAILTGLMLIWLGLNQIRPGLMPGLPLLHPLQGRLHDRLSRAMLHLSFLTSFDWMMQRLGDRWRLLHLLAVPALICCTVHAILVGSHYLGNMEFTTPKRFGRGCWLF
ncbi:urease accessory protein UreH domain-containing protein [Leptodesmis sp.]|uniref:urease accessory protein UreH domain-containing protein n=1 Tax=Leptodesmis sp. TaxID=3100501 RepID=UPI0040534E65